MQGKFRCFPWAKSLKQICFLKCYKNWIIGTFFKLFICTYKFIIHLNKTYKCAIPSQLCIYIINLLMPSSNIKCPPRLFCGITLAYKLGWSCCIGFEDYCDLWLTRTHVGLRNIPQEKTNGPDNIQFNLNCMTQSTVPLNPHCVGVQTAA